MPPPGSPAVHVGRPTDTGHATTGRYREGYGPPSRLPPLVDPSHGTVSPPDRRRRPAVAGAVTEVGEVRQARAGAIEAQKGDEP